ncbi:phosphoglycerate mutase family protein [Candidatus Pelagibacter sp.]|jgi:2,3-bisphosphoglycerate-dependent phosphoglycerate mutase|nr:phosphoglycerate mutase family protein [Candidatus Pelagibacter sp.]
MNNFIICRHCKSSMEGADHERKLDDDGISQSNSLSKKISQKIDSSTIIYASPFVRAMDSLEPLTVSDPSIKIYPDKALKEINIGKSEDLTKHEIIKKMWENKSFKVENGESQEECYSKLKPFLEKVFLEFKNENKNIILVTHGNLIGIILKYFFNLEFNFDSWKQISMPDMYILDFDINKNAVGFKRDVENIENLFYVK